MNEDTGAVDEAQNAGQVGKVEAFIGRPEHGGNLVPFGADTNRNGNAASQPRCFPSYEGDSNQSDGVVRRRWRQPSVAHHRLRHAFL